MGSESELEELISWTRRDLARLRDERQEKWRRDEFTGFIDREIAKKESSLENYEQRLRGMRYGYRPPPSDPNSIANQARRHAAEIDEASREIRRRP